MVGVFHCGDRTRRRAADELWIVIFMVGPLWYKLMRRAGRQERFFIRETLSGVNQFRDRPRCDRNSRLPGTI